MQALIPLTLVCSLVGYSVAHFTTAHLLVNGTDTGLWKSVLEVAVEGNPPNGGFPDGVHFGQIVPQYTYDLFTNNITCGRDAFKSLPKTEVADVIAGKEVGFRTMSDEELGMKGESSYGQFYHPGPAQVWLSRAPNDDLKSYHGDGDWFKVAYAGPRTNYDWKLWNELGRFNFSLPQTTPPGKYLMRFEYFMPTSGRNYTQWFINCALVNIISPPGVTPGTPQGFAKHPGAYDVDDIGLWVPFNQDAGMLPKEQMRILEYKAPGPALWTG